MPTGNMRQVTSDQKQCVQCKLWFTPKNHNQKLCDDDCRRDWRKHNRKVFYQALPKSPQQRLLEYKSSTRSQLKKKSRDELWKIANQAVIKLDLIDLILKEKFGEELGLE